MDFTTSERGPCWDFVNYDTLQADERGLDPKVPWPDGLFAVTRGPWTPPPYLEPPRFIIDPRLGNPLRDAEVRDNFLFISGKFKRLIEEIAPNTCEFRACVTEHRNGEPGPEIWLCALVKAFRDSIDMAASKVTLNKMGGYMFSEEIYLCFKEKEMLDVHLFRIAENSSGFFCDEYFKSKCKEHGIKRILFKEIGELKLHAEEM
ncbi:DUF1629 domain-containing protein [Allorhizobium sp. BGMRC 0089]|uniref:imm11 family protein n=1 Tax=Allorhizobium sonneratiae TaxID=2934936 RepID=UPI0020347490|nr:DUF1629 domain-containing protein [Allorhizobium sonneratiae]MCM2294511.1 DUF1629 domain-containing protein [Allorhizobium sonneratiae]